MTRFIKMLLLAGLVGGVARSGQAFSLLGPYKTWQVTPIGYNLPGDIGGPMTLSEGYRWNVPTIYYAFDQSFIAYFGSNGMAAVDQAMKTFNDVPAFNKITNDGSALYINGEAVPTDVRGPQNFGLQVAGVRDVKSQAMALVLEELGLAEPARWTWTLRARNTETIAGIVYTNYTVIKQNYDPITFQPSSYVNGQLYTYTMFEPIRPLDYADAVETAVSTPAVYAYSAVADQVVGPGEYLLGLSHDDIGGLRFLYNRNNFATEQLLTGVSGGSAFVNSGKPWAAYVGLTNLALGTNVIGNTNATGTNLLLTGIRPGLNKINFRRVNFDSLIGNTIVPITNRYNDLVILNARPIIQPVQRVVNQPDILFTAEDLGLVANLTPILTLRSGTGGWQNNDPLNGNAPQGGPGVITPQVRIRFSDQLPYFSNTDPGSTEDEAFSSAVWGSFDENSEEPIIYPAYLGLTLEDIQRLVKRTGP